MQWHTLPSTTCHQTMCQTRLQNQKRTPDQTYYVRYIAIWSLGLGFGVVKHGGRTRSSAAKRDPLNQSWGRRLRLDSWTDGLRGGGDLGDKAVFAPLAPPTPTARAPREEQLQYAGGMSCATARNTITHPARLGTTSITLIISHRPSTTSLHCCEIALEMRSHERKTIHSSDRPFKLSPEASARNGMSSLVTLNIEMTGARTDSELLASVGLCPGRSPWRPGARCTSAPARRTWRRDCTPAPAMRCKMIKGINKI